MTHASAAASSSSSSTAGPARRPLDRPIQLLIVVALATGILAGLARIGYHAPAFAAERAAIHGPLLAAGVLGTLIGLERAVAFGWRSGRRWHPAYVAWQCPTRSPAPPRPLGLRGGSRAPMPSRAVSPTSIRWRRGTGPGRIDAGCCAVATGSRTIGALDAALVPRCHKGRPPRPPVPPRPTARREPPWTAAGNTALTRPRTIASPRACPAALSGSPSGRDPRRRRLPMRRSTPFLPLLAIAATLAMLATTSFHIA